MEHEDLIVSMKGIQKSFGGVHALTDGELTLRKGEVLGLIGENGAGKSTLMKILSGVYQADAGVMLVDGKEVHYHEPRQALHDGICMIYQELNLVQHLSVGDNIFIGRESQKGWKLDRTKDNRRAEELLKELELDVSPNTTVSSLTVAKQQMIEIAKGISYDSKVLIIKSLFMSQRIIALSCLVFLFLFFSCFGKNFLTKNSMVSLLESVYYIICLAFGMTFVISTGGIDLSIGSVAMCGALIGGVSYNEWHMPIWAALIITVLVTTVFGVLNGFLVSCCKIPPFVATMGTQYLAQGIGYIVSRVQTMRYPVVTSPDGWFKRVFYKSLNGFPMGVIYMVILFVIASFIFRYTKIGKYACAIGSNCEATRLSGVDTRRWTMLVYIIAGVFAGLAGIFYSATYTSVLPGSGSGMEMNAIAAVVIGGTSLSGGSGTMLGTIIGVFIMAVLKNGLMTIGIQQQWQVFFTGLAVLLAVMLDIYRSVKLKRS